MSQPVIRIENISKMYRLGEVGSGTLYQDLNRSWARLRRKPDPYSVVGVTNDREQKGGEYVWALRDINLEIEEGEILGIIGRNGAGKSTLLKLLSRITAPTTGRIFVKGRIASLLEVGTGFHPDLTGHENIYLNGAILGMSHRQIKSRLEEIVDFSGCAKYIDTPVKRYSSGMIVRLGFSVAAHLECEILVIDEVLAVGDAEFQRKCISKIQSVSSMGRTVLFVSHQLNTIDALCKSACLLDMGRLAHVGTTPEILSKYVGVGSESFSEWYNEDNSISGEFTPTKFAVIDSSGKPLKGSVSNADKIGILICGDVLEFNQALKIGFAIYSEEGQLLFWSLSTDEAEENWPKLKKGNNSLVCWLPTKLLNNGVYRVHLIVAIHQTKWIAQPLINAPHISFTINGQLSNSPLWHEKRPGNLAPILEFECLS